MGNWHLSSSKQRLTVVNCRAIAAICLPVITLLLIAPEAHSALPWDGDGGDSWWFNPANWNRNMNDNHTLPPGDSAGVTDTQLNLNTAALPGGEGVVYDPDHDPNYPPDGSITFPSGFGPQTIRELYMGRDGQSGVAQPVPDNLLTIKSGNLDAEGSVQIGRSSGVAGISTNATIVQTGGTFNVRLSALDLGQSDTSHPGIGNGTYDYRGGILTVSTDGGNGLRLSTGGSAGPGGVGKFIMHNPTTGGYARAYDLRIADNGGVAGNADLSPDGVKTGVGIFEFHFENGGTRPFQVSRNLSINNGLDTSDNLGIRSSRLDLKLDAAPTLNGGVPQNLGLFDVDSDGDTVGVIQGTGDLGQFFSSIDATKLYDTGAMVSATFGSVKYNWTISYTGDIQWSDIDNSVVQSISGTGGKDIVLIGLSSENAGLPGDFNNNGTVDAADYTVWRDNLGKADETTLLHGNGDGMNGVDAGDYTLWKSKFGTHNGAGSLSAGAVPEPGTILMSLLSMIGLVTLRRRAC